MSNAKQNSVQGEMKKRRGRAVQSITIPVSRQTMAVLETYVMLGQATSASAVAGKLLARAAEDLRENLARQLSSNLGREQKSESKE
ncbi:MAG: hypothetical protein ACUVR8_05680 [Acidobacteriota bacterium]